jgi:CBS domain-containing protein
MTAFKTMRDKVSICGRSSPWKLTRVRVAQFVSGVAIVDDGGRLVGSLSVRDLKGLQSENGGLELSRLTAPVRQYVQYITSLLIDVRVSVWRDCVRRLSDSRILCAGPPSGHFGHPK